MKIKNLLSIERLIGKIDNDFNISESDWIPRVAAWCIDALNQMNCLPLERKRRKLEVNNKQAKLPCIPAVHNIRVYDCCGNAINNLQGDETCTIKENINPNEWLNGNSCNTCSFDNYTNPEINSRLDSRINANYHIDNIQKEIALIDNSNKTGIDFMKIAKITEYVPNPNFILSGNTIELNFNTNHIYVETLETAMYYDEYYDCEVPYIYDDGLLLEALSWYVLYKYLSRGSKHPVFDLGSPNQALNPYVQWNILRPKAAASVKIALHNDKGWANFFYNYTFLPRK